MASSREGFTADILASAARRMLVSPFVASIGVLALSLELASFYRLGPYVHFQNLPRWWRVAGYVGSIPSFTLWVNEYITDEVAKNWINDSGWDWDEEIVLVTGGSSGIGSNIIQQLLAKNPQTTIIVLDHVPPKWKATQDSKIHFYQCDLSKSGAVEPTCAKMRKEVGHPTVPINNAGLSRGLTVMEGSITDVDVMVRTNLIAPFLLIKEFLPHMVDINHGHIVNVSSISSLIPPARIADYAATKAGLGALHESLQLELKNIHKAPKVRLSLVILSFVRAPLFKGKTNMSNFLFPLLHVDTVGKKIVEILYSGRGKTIYMPGIFRYISMLRAAPEWIFRIVREGTGKVGVDIKGRQQVDNETGSLR
ncbi:short-chain dehydrogenase [Hypoxylon crocopeplum]|nr:short-chain dehydrogenase [Hypoxylon crocopeplum]